MDWDYIEAEIMETILWRIKGPFSVEDVISVVCREYSLEFPRFKKKMYNCHVRSTNDLHTKIMFL